MEAVSHAPKVKGESYLQVYNLREANMDKSIHKSTGSPGTTIVIKVLISRNAEQRGSAIKKKLGGHTKW